ncbi:MAG TPA: hypothetical protein VLX44_07225 [Xanthobacteraceae bacterium]|nr:hypothetical protein [Xanthobacteraceae bacterium]
MSTAGAILYCLAAYAAVGAVTAVAFVAVGLARVLPHPMPATLGARILLLPGSLALWPYILIRWHRARSRR